MSKLKMPDFETEREEADWWFQNQDLIAQEYAEEHAPELLALLLSEDDVNLAMKQAGKQGVSPNDYVRSLLHDALQQQRAA